MPPSNPPSPSTGLTPLEESAYRSCIKLSCAHEKCIKVHHNTIKKPTRAKEVCGALFVEWEECFARRMGREEEGR